MKKIISQILIVTMLTLGIGGTFAVPKVAHAACNIATSVLGNGLTDCVFEISVAVFMPIVSKFLQLSAYLFDHALMLNMNIAKYLQPPTCAVTTTNGNECTVSPVEVIWRLIRDLSGMFFIFILMWASIKMILGGENSKGVIVGVIVAGLLVNFSLFATKVVVDASNSLTLTVYNAIAPGQSSMSLYDSLPVPGGFTDQPTLYGRTGTISSKIMDVIDLQSIFAATKKASTGNFNVNSIVILIGGVSLMLVFGLALLAAAMMFLWRFIMLLALMAFSPIPALAYGLPSLKKYSETFFKNLLGQAFFAPIFLFYIYIALKILTNDAFLQLSGKSNNNFANILSGVGGGVGPLIQYAIVIVVIFYGLSHAKDMGGKGADWGMKTIDGLGKWGQGVVTGATKGAGSFVGRNTLGVASKAASKGFDKLEAGVANSKYGFLANNDITRGLSATLKAGAKAKYGYQSIDDREALVAGRKKDLDDITRFAVLKDKIKSHLIAPTTDHKALKAELTKLSGKNDLEGLGDDIYNKKLAAQLSTSQVESILKSDKLDDSEKTKFKDARVEGIKDIAMTFKHGDIDDILKKESLSDEQKKVVTDARTEGLKTVVDSGDTVKVKEVLGNVSGKEIAKFVGKNPHPGGSGKAPAVLVENLKLSHVQDMDDLDVAWKRDIGDQIRTIGKNHHAWDHVNKNKGSWRT